MTCVVSVPAYPVLTRARVATPPLKVRAKAWAKACPLLSGVSAELGTVRTPSATPISRLTPAWEPEASAAEVSGTRTTRGMPGCWTPLLTAPPLSPLQQPWVAG